MSDDGSAYHPEMLHPSPWSEISDEELERELAHAHNKRHDTFVGGTAHAWDNLIQRTAQLEVEYLRRFPDRVAEAADKRRLYPSSEVTSTE